MQFTKDRFNYLFGSTKGLILVAIAMVAMVTAVWGMLSGPMAELGVREVVIKTLGMDIVQSEREGRIWWKGRMKWYVRTWMVASASGRIPAYR